MSEELKNQETVTPAEPKVEEKKMFSQEALDAIVESRLSREKAKYVDFENYKKSHEQLQLMLPKIGEYESKLAESNIYKSTVEQILQEKISSLTDEQKALVPEQFNPLEKLNYVNKIQIAFKQPQPNGGVQPEVKLLEVKKPNEALKSPLPEKTLAGNPRTR
jgi:hypothetical protein